MQRAAKGRRTWAGVLGLVAVLLAVVLPALASASEPSPIYAETRVWAFELKTPAGVGAERGLSPTGTGAYSAPYDEPAVGYPLVPRGTARLDDLLSSAGQPDRGGLTRAGRSLTKHGQGAREGNRLFPQARGNPEQINRQAQAIVEEILGNPETTVLRSSRGRFGDTVEYIAPDGRGLVYDAQGRFLFFRE